MAKRLWTLPTICARKMKTLRSRKGSTKNCAGFTRRRRKKLKMLCRHSSRRKRGLKSAKAIVTHPSSNRSSQANRNESKHASQPPPAVKSQQTMQALESQEPWQSSIAILKIQAPHWWCNHLLLRLMPPWKWWPISNKSHRSRL